MVIRPQNQGKGEPADEEIGKIYNQFCVSVCQYYFILYVPVFQEACERLSWLGSLAE